jgi:hypothetical protein
MDGDYKGVDVMDSLWEGSMSHLSGYQEIEEKLTEVRIGLVPDDITRLAAAFLHANARLCVRVVNEIVDSKAYYFHYSRVRIRDWD